MFCADAPQGVAADWEWLAVDTQSAVIPKAKNRSRVRIGMGQEERRLQTEAVYTPAAHPGRPAANGVANSQGDVGGDDYAINQAVRSPE